MFKQVVLVLVLATLASSLKMHALELSHMPGNPFGDSDQANLALQRMMNFARSNPDILNALLAKKQLDGQNMKKFANFMIEDQFFQKQLFKGFDSEELKWFKKLSNPTKVRFVKMVVSYDKQQFKDPQKVNELMNKLMNDPQIGPVIKAQYGDQLDEKVLQKAFNSVNKSSSMSHLEALQLLID